ncbi:MAG: aspartate carbamoyltransferase catalytic subunit [Rhizobiaceae bacterium]|nr:aspartate carbamoyltransferase catalytic subunit [Rhizobiaceae bacterium]
MTDARQPATRHLISINDLTNDEIESVFETAASYLEAQRDPDVPHRIKHSSETARGRILASLFYEPSTRTRLSFESAMLRLGGASITSADPATASTAKGESLADSVRVISNYADLIVLRHPRDGAARLAAKYAGVPVINGGDGSHEHPTQTLCDLFTLRRENRDLKGLNVALSGDLRGSRTIHSFIYALARFNANLILMPAKGMGLPEHVDRRLREEFRCVPAPTSDLKAADASVDALYVTADQPHQLSLLTEPDLGAPIDIASKLAQVDVVYVTRFQKERWKDKEQEYPKIGTNFLKATKYSGTRVMHPLPRVDELDVEFDADPRAVYFQQAAYGVPVRMAIIAALLGLAGERSLKQHAGGFAPTKQVLYSRPPQTGLRCANPNCIVHDPLERHYATNDFHLDMRHGSTLRCLYCEGEIDGFVAADRQTRQFAGFDPALHCPDEVFGDDVVLFASEDDARAAGFGPAAAGHGEAA